MPLTLEQAQSIISDCLSWRKDNGLKPLTIAVLDAGGSLIALAREDGTSALRPEIAQGKARGAIQMGLGSRALYERAKVEPFFIQAMNALSDGSLVPVAGGVPVISIQCCVLGPISVVGTGPKAAHSGVPANDNHSTWCTPYVTPEAGSTNELGTLNTHDQD